MEFFEQNTYPSIPNVRCYSTYKLCALINISHYTSAKIISINGEKYGKTNNKDKLKTKLFDQLPK